MTEYRIEHDTMGEVAQANALYRAQTQRAVDNSPISGSASSRATSPRSRASRRAAALANKVLKLESGIADAIAWAADQIVTGEYDAQFPVNRARTRMGTSSNMNMNEVLSTLATEKLGSEVHPERPRQRVAVLERSVPDVRARRRH